jgi:hypothetical protein
MSTPVHTWPPLLADLKKDLKLDANDALDDDQLNMDLAAAIAWAEGLGKAYRFDTTDPDQVTLAAPPDDFWLGTVRYAVRLGDRRRSKDGMVNMGELGVTRVTSYDNDIDRLMKIGKFRPMSEQFA